MTPDERAAVVNERIVTDLDAISDDLRQTIITATHRLGASKYPGHMVEERFWTAAELEQLSPNERAAVIQKRVVTDLGQLDPELVERVRAKGRELLESRGVIDRPET